MRIKWKKKQTIDEFREEMLKLVVTGEKLLCGVWRANERKESNLCKLHIKLNWFCPIWTKNLVSTIHLYTSHSQSQHVGECRTQNWVWLQLFLWKLTFWVIWCLLAHLYDCPDATEQTFLGNVQLFAIVLWVQRNLIGREGNFSDFLMRKLVHNLNRQNVRLEMFDKVDETENRQR